MASSVAGAVGLAPMEVELRVVLVLVMLVLVVAVVVLLLEMLLMVLALGVMLLLCCGGGGALGGCGAWRRRNLMSFFFPIFWGVPSGAEGFLVSVDVLRGKGRGWGGRFSLPPVKKHET